LRRDPSQQEIALGGLLAIVIGTGRPTPTSIALGREWDAPLGGVLIFLCGVCALSGFPLDDVWHRIFGQDVTLWGPTHLLMVGGASLATHGKWKAMIRVENGRAVDAVALYLPNDPAIPAKGVPASARFTRPFVRDKEVLQREATGGAPGLSVVPYGVLLAIAAAWLVALGIGLRRLQRTAGERYPDDGLAARAREGAEGDARRPAVGVQA
jgi:hypothetical protein